MSSDLARCRAALKGGSRSFHLAAVLLPPRVREPAAVLYAFCREADDLVDQGGGIAALRVLRARLRRLAGSDRQPRLPPGGTGFTGQPGASDRLLGEVMARHQIPTGVLAGLLEGFSWDVQGRQYADQAALLAYAMRVAGTVGLAMALLMGARGRRPLLAAAALGMAMQLTNICRDVAEDARLGRLYLPTSWLAEEGIDARAWLLDPRPAAGLNRVVARVLGLADACYALGDGGLASLPRDCQGGIRTARRLYAGIGHRLRREGCDPMQGRVVLSPLAKAAAVLSPQVAQVDPARLRAAERACEWAAAGFLARLPQPLLLAPPAAADAHPRVLWLLELFERLERRRPAMQGGRTDGG